MMRKRIFAAFVCLCMLMALVPSMAHAGDTVYMGGVCGENAGTITAAP